MTDGTSQGLFVVVAIVIFGIFVALSYTVFGSDGLSNGLENLVTQSLEETHKRLGFGSEDIELTNLITPTSVYGNVNYHTPVEYNDGVFSTTIIREVPNGILSLRNEPRLEQDARYTISGYLKVNGLPAERSQWITNRTHDYIREEHYENFFVDDSTGYFEATYRQVTTDGLNIRLFHIRLRNENGNLIRQGDTIEISDFTLIKH